MHRPEQHPAVARLLARLPRWLQDAACRGRAHVLLKAVVYHGALHVRAQWTPAFEPNTACQYASNCAMEHGSLPTLSRISPASQCYNCSCARVCDTVGGDQRRVEIHLIAHPDDDQTDARRLLLEQFATFDAGKARCFLASDREHLLAVIEAGFGDFYDFNRVARSLLARRVFDRNSSSWEDLWRYEGQHYHTAALRLQALARGRATRAALLGRAQAATRLQAVVRGWLVRAQPSWVLLGFWSE